MVKSAAEYLKNVDRSSLGARTAVIVGGTSGMGAKVAELLSEYGVGRIIIVGRNAQRGAATVENIRHRAPAGGQVRAEYIRGDVSVIQGMKTAADAIGEAAGRQGIDYLVMTQNGVPTGLIQSNADGMDPAFAIQAVSRFVIPHRLISRGHLAPGAKVMSIANNGQTLSDLSLDDLSLHGERYRKMWHARLFGQQSARDSCVLDAFHEEFRLRYKEFEFFHVWPGLVKTPDFTLGAFPLVFRPLVALGLWTIGQTPERFAPAPVALLLNPAVKADANDAMCYAYTLKPSAIGAWASDPENREKLWEWLIDEAS